MGGRGRMVHGVCGGRDGHGGRSGRGGRRGRDGRHLQRLRVVGRRFLW